MVDFESMTALWISDGATVTLVNSSFNGINIVGRAFNRAVISVNAVSNDTNIAQQQDSILRLQQCSITGNKAASVIAASNIKPFQDFEARVFSDVSFSVQYNADSQPGLTQPLSAAPASRPGITASSVWFKTAHQVCSKRCPTTRHVCGK